MRRLLFLLLFVPALRLHAQQVEVTRHDVDQGLPQSMVNHVLQDHDGFIWLGTGDGLSRFDGRNHVVYKHDPRDPTSLSHNSIWGLAEQDERHLWVGTRAGLDLLDRRTGRFQHVSTGEGAVDGCWHPVHQGPERLLFYSPLLKSFLLSDGDRMERRSLHHYDSYAMRTSDNGRRVHQYLRPDSLVTIDLDNGGEQVRLLPIRPGESVLDLLELDDRWLVLTDRGGWLWNGGTERLALPPDLLALLERGAGSKHLERAPDGTLWLGISGVGVVTVNADLTVRARYPLLPPDQRPLTITRIAFDRQGNTWVGTDGKGVFKIAPQRVRSGRCMPGQGLPWEPPSWFVRGFAQWDSSHVLVSFHQGGLALFDENTLTLSPLELPALGASARTGDHRMLQNDRRGRIWMKEDMVIRAIDPLNGAVVSAVRDTCGAVIGKPLDGGVWIGSVCTPFAMVSDAPGPPTLVPFHAPALAAHLRNVRNTPQYVAVDDHERIWISSEVMPLSVWGKKGGIPFAKSPIPLPGDQLRMTGLEKDGPTLWMTTNEGLLQWRAEDLTLLRHYTVHDGTPDQYLYCMLPAGDGTWWISSNNGLGHFDPRQGTFRNEGTTDGLQSKEFNSRAALRSTRGRLYFGGINGFNHFMPGALRSDGDTAGVQLIGLMMQDSTIDLRAFDGTPLIALPHERNALRIDLAVLEFTAPERNTYRYRIQGYSEWTSHPADRPIILANMPAGTYALEVCGVNGHGLSSRPRTLLTIHVPLPFWASPWAFVLIGSLVAAALGGVGFALYRRRVKDRMARAEQQMKELRIRTRIAHDLHDDVGSGLAQIGALARMAERLAGKGELPAEQVTKVKDISQELMDNLRDVVWVNDPTDGDLPTLLIRMKDHVRDLFEPGGVSCTFDLPAPLPERSVGNGFKRNLFLLFKEAAHNAFKYSGTERIALRFTLDADTFTCALTDHGSGVQHGPAKGGGHGLANMRERAEEIGARLDIATTAGGGTTVSLSGPLSCLDH